VVFQGPGDEEILGDVSEVLAYMRPEEGGALLLQAEARSLASAPTLPLFVDMHHNWTFEGSPGRLLGSLHPPLWMLGTCKGQAADPHLIQKTAGPQHDPWCRSRRRIRGRGPCHASWRTLCS
jgi:hypothetical protein